MLGLMQDWPLLCHRIIDHAAIQHPDRPVVSRSVEGPIHTTNYAEVRQRALKVAQRLERDGVRRGDRVATLGWNTWRHIEAWYGIVGIGAIYHTVNPRLFPEQIVWIVNHAEDRVMIVGSRCLRAAGGKAHCRQAAEHRALCDLPDRCRAHAANHLEERGCPTRNGSPRSTAQISPWAKDFDENTAAAGMCYTSGTTGNPKGVLYSHRSNVLHAFMASLPDAKNIAARDVVLPVVPLFHANCWSLAFSTPLTGASLILPGPKLDGASIYELLDTYKVTFTAGVPTVWLALLDHMEKNNLKLPALKRIVIGGSASPRAMTQKFEQNYGVDVIHAWGMTEMSPLGSLCTMKPEYAALTGDAKLDVQMKQGHPPFGVEMKITDDSGKPLPWDGKTFGRLQGARARGGAALFQGRQQHPSTTGRLLRHRRRCRHHGPARLHADHRSLQGCDQVRRRMDFHRSTSENLAVGHPKVAEAAVIGVQHPKWDERPLLVVVLKKDQKASKDDILGFMAGKIAKWWMPDDVAFVEEIPHTATGKILKTELRERFKDYRLPTVAA